MQSDENAAPLPYDAFCCTATGAVHERLNTPCQDFAGIEKRGDFIAAAVCDGHGGADYIRSEKGSRLACAAAIEGLSNRELLEALSLAKDEREVERLILQLKKSIIFIWNEQVERDIAQNAFEQTELERAGENMRRLYEAGDKIEIAYGTTLICCVLTRSFFLALQIGDGLLVAVDGNGNFSEPIPEDERCFMNYTTSICTDDALDNARHYFSRELPKAAFLGSDGVDKSFAAREHLHNFYTLTLRSAAQNGVQKAGAEMEDFIPRLSKIGSGDDISIAAILRI